MALAVKNPLANAGDVSDVGLIPESGIMEEGMTTHRNTGSISAWRIPWTEEPDGLQSVGLQRIGHN